MISTLGTGSTGCVCAYRQRDNGDEVALKLVKIDSEEKRKEALMEI
jgi:serine/threonine protein kinase